jgi:hypothetical protein
MRFEFEADDAMKRPPRVLDRLPVKSLFFRYASIWIRGNPGPLSIGVEDTLSLALFARRWSFPP